MASSNVPQYPAMFDPSQLVNKYSDMNSAKFPMYNYYGTPTDAMGNPIDSYLGPNTPAPGVTLNTTPAQTAAPTTVAPINYAARTSQPNGLPQGWNQNTTNGGIFVTQPPQPYSPMQQQAAPQQQSPIASSGFNYLLALANPNKVKTPGVYNYPATTYQQDSSSIDAILQSMQSGPSPWPAQRPGIGGGSQDLSIIPNSSFLNTLAALRAGSPSSGAK